MRFPYYGIDTRSGERQGPLDSRWGGRRCSQVIRRKALQNREEGNSPKREGGKDTDRFATIGSKGNGKTCLPEYRDGRTVRKKIQLRHAGTWEDSSRSSTYSKREYIVTRFRRKKVTRIQKKTSGG